MLDDEPLNRSVATLKSPLATVLVCPFVFAGERFLDQGNTILKTEIEGQKSTIGVNQREEASASRGVA